MKICVNDMVEVISGVEKGKRGRVLQIFTGDSPNHTRVLVQGVNVRHKHIRRSQKHPQGGRIEKEMPLHVSKVMLIDPKNDKPTRVGIRHEGDDRLRVSKKSGEVIKRGAS